MIAVLYTPSCQDAIGVLLCDIVTTRGSHIVNFLVRTVSRISAVLVRSGPMSTDAEWFADRTRLQILLQTQPAWTITDLAQAVGRSISWVKKWRKRIRAAPNDDRIVNLIHSQGLRLADSMPERTIRGFLGGIWRFKQPCV